MGGEQPGARSLRVEARRLASLAVPVALAQLAIMGMGFVDLVVVGRVSVEAFAAVAIANPWQYATLLFANGILMGLDPLVAQAHGAREGERAALAFQQGIVLALLMSPFVIFAWTQTEEVLRLLGQDPALAHQAERFLLVQIPSVPFFLSYAALRQYLQGREIVRPVLWVVLLGNVVNALANWVLVFGHWGFPALGLVGAGLATSLTRIAMFGAGVGLVLGFRLHEGAWVPWSRRAFEGAGLRALLAIGFPIAIQMSLEMWAFAGSNFIAGGLGAEAVAAHSLVMNLASITFMVPLGIAQGTAVRVGNLIGGEARRVAARGLARDRHGRGLHDAVGGRLRAGARGAAAPLHARGRGDRGGGRDPADRGRVPGLRRHAVRRVRGAARDGTAGARRGLQPGRLLGARAAARRLARAARRRRPARPLVGPLRGARRRRDRPRAADLAPRPPPRPPRVIGGDVG